MRSSTSCARLAAIIGSLAVTGPLTQPLLWATPAEILPIEPLDDALFLPSLSSTPSNAVGRASSDSRTPGLEESSGPTDLFATPVPNEGDLELLHALNAAIYEFLYSGTEEARQERWRRIWRPYLSAPQSNADIMLESLPPAHLCSPAGSPSSFYTTETEAKGTFAENILQQQHFVYFAQFSLPPFLFLSRKAPQGYVDLEDIDYTPGELSQGYGILMDVLHLGVISALRNKYHLAKLSASWSFRVPSCDIRLVADGTHVSVTRVSGIAFHASALKLEGASMLQAKNHTTPWWQGNESASSYMASMQMGLVSPTPYVQKYLSTTCPLMMYGKLTLLRGYGRKGENVIEAWNSPRLLIGTLDFVPWKKPVAEQLPRARIREYSSFIQLLAATRHGPVDGVLLPAAAATVLSLKFGNIFGRYGVSQFTKPQVVGHIGSNNLQIVYTVRRYPMRPPYINTFFDESYNASETNCQEILYSSQTVAESLLPRSCGRAFAAIPGRLILRTPELYEVDATAAEMLDAFPYHTPLA